MNLPKISFSQPSLISGLKKLFVYLFFLLLAIFITAFLVGFLSALSTNIQVSGVTGALAFDPLITIAYIIVFHYAAHFAQLPRKASVNFFLLTLFLSFTTNFVPGSIFLLTFIYFTHKYLLSKDTQA